MSQLELRFDPRARGREAWTLVLEALKGAVQYLTPKEVAWRLDVGATTLSDSLAEKERKPWHQSWTLVIKAMLVDAATEQAAAHLAAIVEAELVVTGLTAVWREHLTIEDEARMLRDQLARFGDAGREAASSVPRGRR